MKPYIYSVSPIIENASVATTFPPVLDAMNKIKKVTFVYKKFSQDAPASTETKPAEPVVEPAVEPVVEPVVVPAVVPAEPVEEKKEEVKEEEPVVE